MGKRSERACRSDGDSGLAGVADAFVPSSLFRSSVLSLSLSRKPLIAESSCFSSVDLGIQGVDGLQSGIRKKQQDIMRERVSVCCKTFLHVSVVLSITRRGARYNETVCHVGTARSHR